MIKNLIPKIGERVELASRFVPESKKLLDVGCGDGAITYFINKKVKLIYGIDMFISNLIEAEKLGIKTKLVDLDKEKIPFDNNFFDVVTCLDVIEHIKDHQFLVSELYRVTKKNGILIITTPNIRFTDHLLKLIIKGTFPRTSVDKSFLDEGHIHYFTSQDIKNLLIYVGFKISIEKGIINKLQRGWKGRILEKILGKNFMKEFRSPGILVVAKK